MAAQLTVWTIGHSTLPIDEFVELLRANAMAAVADVRRFPGSRRHPQFDRNEMAASLARSGIEYAHFPDLGGRRQPRPDSNNSAWRNAAFRGYADHMETEDFRTGVDWLVTLAQKNRLAIMCAEAVWWRCHRALISDYLQAAGHHVLHIGSDGKTTPHPYTSAAQIIDGRLSYASEARLP